MPKRKSAVTLMIDAEGEFGRIAFNPKDKSLHKIKMLASYLLKLDYSVKTFSQMLEVLKKYKFPATLFVVGSLYIEKKNKNLLREYLKTKPKTEYLFKKNKLIGEIPSWGDYIKKNAKEKIFDWGVHNFLHESNFIETNEQIEISIEYSIKAAKILGINPKTYSAPWFELEDESRPERIYSLLKKHGITVTRFDGVREKEGYVIKSRLIKPPFIRYGIKCVNSSHFIGDGKVDKEEYKIIKEGIEKAIRTNSIYAISTHDTTFLRHGIKHFENIIKLIKSYSKKIDIVTLSDF